MAIYIEGRRAHNVSLGVYMMTYVGRPVEAGQYIKGSGVLPKGAYIGGLCDVRMGGHLCWATVIHAHLPSQQIVVVPDKHWVVLREGQLQGVMSDGEFNQWYMPIATAAEIFRVSDENVTVAVQPPMPDSKPPPISIDDGHRAMSEAAFRPKPENPAEVISKERTVVLTAEEAAARFPKGKRKK